MIYHDDEESFRDRPAGETLEDDAQAGSEELWKMFLDGGHLFYTRILLCRGGSLSRKRSLPTFDRRTGCTEIGSNGMGMLGNIGIHVHQTAVTKGLKLAREAS